VPAALKGVRDELAAQLGVDDRDPRVRWVPLQDKGRDFAVRVQVERLEAKHE
jgi:hypothetical protein